MTERARTSVTDDRERGRRDACTPVEHVRTQCPVLIATLVAIAREAQDNAKWMTNLADRENR